jgi:Integrase core domain
MSLQVLKTPVRAPQANAYCERFIGTARRECLDWMIPLGKRHLPAILAEWISHYNSERPHSALGPGFRTIEPCLADIDRGRQNRPTKRVWGFIEPHAGTSGAGTFEFARKTNASVSSGAYDKRCGVTHYLSFGSPAVLNVAAAPYQVCKLRHAPFAYTLNVRSKVLR